MTDIRILKSPEDFAQYDYWARSHPQGSLWQSLRWKQYQEAMGREVRVYVAGEGTILASALVAIDRTAGGYSTWDIPRGPLWRLSGVRCQVSGADAATKLLNTIVHDTKRDQCLTLFFSPTVHLKAESYNLKASHRHEQPTATRLIDLTQSEEEILAKMHPKGRYNIKVAQKNGVRVEQSRDAEAFYGLLQETAKRDGFHTLPLKAYKAFLESLPGSFLLLAYENGPKAIAGLLGVIWGQTGIYYYGASDYTSRSLMAPYALQWEAMRLCKARGCTTYDLLGVTSPSVTGTSHPWAGVSAFKERFGGTIVTYPQEQQIVLRPLLWKVLQWKREIVG